MTVLFKTQRTDQNYSSLIEYIEHGVSCCGVSQQLMDFTMRHVSTTDLCDHLSMILNNPDALNELGKVSMLHPNGFYKLQLFVSKFLKIRLHYWSPQNLIAEENIHNHRWRMVSKLMHGSLQNEIFKESVIGNDGSQPVEKATLRMYRKSIGAMKAQGVLIGEQNVVCTKRLHLSKNNIYYMDENTLHRVKHPNVKDGVITLVVQSSPIFQDNYMLSSENVEQPNLDLDCLSSTCLRQVLEEMIGLMSLNKDVVSD